MIGLVANRASTDGGSSRARPRPVDDRRSTASDDRWWTGWTGALALVAVWAVANVAWIQANRGARLWDHEEVGYVRGVAHLGRLRQGSSMWDALHSGYTGPMQALLGAPSQWAFGVDEATVVWENVALTAATGLLVYWVVRRLADRTAGLAAAALVLLVPGMIENARGALTMVPATTFAALAVAALVVGGGLSRARWSVLLGVALGCMSLSRTMSVAFVPGLAIPAVVWSLAVGTPRWTIVRNAVLAAAAAVAVSVWWWAFSYDEVLDYLAVGSPNIETAGPPIILIARVAEIVLYLGPLVPLIAGIAYLVLLRRQRGAEAPPVREHQMAAVGGPAEALTLDPAPSGDAGAAAPSAATPGAAATSTPAEPTRWQRWTKAAVPTQALDGADTALPLWPLWAAIGADLLVSLASNTVGWLMLPLVPWLIIVAVAGVRRRLDRRSWRTWVLLVVGSTAVIAVLTSTLWIKPGNRFTWCQEPIMVTTACVIDDDGEARLWRTALDTVVDDTFALHESLLTQGRRAEVAIAARDHIVLPSAIQLGAEVRHRWAFDPYRFFPLDRSPEAQLEELRRDADIVVISPDVEPVVLTTAMYDPDELAAQLVGSGFAECRSVALPDGRVVRTLVREPVPADVCR